MKIPQGFLRALIDAPDDDAPRLILADWLEDDGQHDRAEFVRLQIEAATPDLEAGRAVELSRRERALLAAHGTAWAAPFGKAHGPRHTRGFVSSVAVGGRELLKRGRAFFAAAPLTSLSLHVEEEDAVVAKLAACECLGRLRSLDLSGSPLGPERAATLFASPHLAGLRSLHLGEGDATPERVALLAGRLAHLRELYLWDFHQGDLGDAGLAALADEPAFAGLTTLNLLQTGVGPAGARAVAESPHLRGLESLSFGFQACGYAPNHIRAEGVRALANAPGLAGLRHLSLGLTEARCQGARELAASPYLRGLRSLDLSLTRLADAGLSALAESPCLAGVTCLNVSVNEIGSAGVVALARSPQAANLQTLWLTNNRLGDDAVRALASSPHLGRLRRLSLAWNPLTSASVAVMSGDGRFADLAELHVSGDWANDDDKRRLSAHFGDRVVL